MEVLDVVAVLTSVADYGAQLAKVFHSYSLSASRIPRGLEGSINILDATVLSLRQVLELLETKDNSQERKALFNENGLRYIRLLALECATTLAKVEPSVEEACLGNQERKALQKQKRKSGSKNLVTILDPLTLKLDEKCFLEKIEQAKWNVAIGDVNDYMDRLYELQLHLYLIFQVGTVALVSRDVSSGKINVQNVVKSYERIKKTAKLVGIDAHHRSNGKYGRNSLSSDSESTSSSSESDFSSNDSSSSRSTRGKTKRGLRFSPPPPPPPLPPTPASGQWKSHIEVADPPKMNVTQSAVTTESTNPPAYTDQHEAKASESSGTGTTVVAKELNAPAPETKSSGYPSEKDQQDKDSPSNPQTAIESKVPEPQLFNPKPSSLGFRFKSMFRSKASLAQEMRQTLSNDEHHLTAFVISRQFSRAIPHSAFHSLESTHLRTILCQLNSSDWYKTFTTLDATEAVTLNRLTKQWVAGNSCDRELLVLKVLHENRANRWMVRLSEFKHEHPISYREKGRTILAICREKLVDGKTVEERHMEALARMPPPPRPIVPLPNNPKGLKPLPAQIRRYQYSNMVSDLSKPPASVSPSPQPGMPWTPPAPPPPGGVRGPGPNASSRISDTTPAPTEAEAREALTSFAEYTLRLCAPLNPGEARTWSRASITTEFTERHVLRQRVLQFEQRGGNVIQGKLVMSEAQTGQLARIMDRIKSDERDSRFEWWWAEISLFDERGEICDLRPTNTLAITMIHVIAKRCLKTSFRPLDVYHSLLNKPSHGAPFAMPPPPMQSAPLNIAASKPRKPMPRRYRDDSDSDSSRSSRSSVGAVRRRLRRYQANRQRARRLYYDSDSDEETEDEDVIKVDVELKRGDSVVQKLLELWTEDVGDKGEAVDD
ncbi:hypothetical protein B0O99DRAFT_598966 [Bisporella sp. PMI_857]|nr:hypothetical protein B0O99DRAFT_598966 [Bisporella sp. PMI_857]